MAKNKNEKKKKQNKQHDICYHINCSSSCCVIGFFLNFFRKRLNGYHTIANTAIKKDSKMPKTTES
ncbi:hypothetical protein OZK63_40855, partial [Streptomyces sp. UMAF16]|nr:hypothetical protein [Streptomyces sp. UMAF16]